jgi:hypothetical protein
VRVLLNKLLPYFSPIAIACALTSCSLRLNDHVEQPQHTVNAGSGCLSQAGDVLDKFQNGTLSREQHDALYSCVDKALTTFQSYAVGNSKDSFAPEELGGFLTKYFLDGKPIQPALLHEVMVLKVALVGGPADKLTRDDLRRVMEVIKHVHDLSSALRPLMPFNARSFLARGFTGAEFEQAMNTFTGATATLGASFAHEQGDYDFQHLAQLVTELRKFLYPGGQVPEAHWSNITLRFANALPAAKQIFIAPPRERMTAADWPKFYRLAPRYFVSMQRVQFYLNSPFNTVQKGGLQTLEKLFNDFMTTFNFVIDQQPNKQITSEEIDEFLNALADEQFLPCSPDTARQFIQVVFGRLLGTADQKKFSVTKESLSRFVENMRFFLEGAHAAEAMYRPKFGDNFVQGILSADEISATPDATLLGATLMNDLSSVAVAQLKNTPQTVRTVFAGSGNAVVIPEHGGVTEFSFMHMLKIHGLRSLNRLLIQSYGSKNANELTPAQVEAFVNDVFPMLKEVHIADDSVKTMVPKRLLEASLFLYSSTGSENLGMNQALEMESLLLSTVLTAADVHKKIAAACNVKPQSNAKGKALPVTVPYDCYREKFLGHLDKIWSFLPGMVRYEKSLSTEDRAALFDSMASFLKGNKQEFTISDTQCLVHFPYYVEILYSRFDQNGDGLLDNAEAAAAYPVFRPLIAEKANAKGYTKEKDYAAIYNFLLAFRVLPTDDKWDFALHRYLLGDKKFTNDRAQIVDIFEKLLTL